MQSKIDGHIKNAAELDPKDVKDAVEKEFKEGADQVTVSQVNKDDIVEHEDIKFHVKKKLSKGRVQIKVEGRRVLFAGDIIEIKGLEYEVYKSLGRNRFMVRLRGINN